MDALTLFLNRICERHTEIEVYLERIECMIGDLESEYFIFEKPKDNDLQMVIMGYDDARVKCDIASIFLRDVIKKTVEMKDWLQYSVKELAEDQEVEK